LSVFLFASIQRSNEHSHGAPANAPLHRKFSPVMAHYFDVVISVDWRSSIPKSNELHRTAPNLDATTKNARFAVDARDEINR
jgi:hypothetical protein